ncbi:hypothetical protein SAMN05444161_9408 [Rhizobiales bacterium GAS191]|nr:hypothetical protein SAMN05444161_9408 [Rhizobiales bacterium GAS191]
MAASKEPLIVGMNYFGVKCHSCRNFISILPDPQPGTKAFHILGTLRVGCPFCRQADKYGRNEVVSRALKLTPPTAH